jgi:hypothetical protein
MAGPFVVVVASLASAWIAMASDDGVVADDYYKQGLLINRRLAREAADPTRELGATITGTGSGEVRARLQGLQALPASLRLKLARPNGQLDQVVILVPAPDGDYVGMLRAESLGRRIVTLESDAWRLPVTTITGRISEIRLGSAASRG